MRPKIGDTVYVEGCVFNTGTHYIQECKLVEIAPDHIELRHDFTLTKNGREPASGATKRWSEAEKTLDWLARPIEERFKEHVDCVNELCERIIEGR